MPICFSVGHEILKEQSHIIPSKTIVLKLCEWQPGIRECTARLIFSLFNCDLQDVVNMQQGVCVYVHLLLSLHTHLVWKHGAFNL